jgi:hypothetical protein
MTENNSLSSVNRPMLGETPTNITRPVINLKKSYVTQPKIRKIGSGKYISPTAGSHNKKQSRVKVSRIGGSKNSSMFKKYLVNKKKMCSSQYGQKPKTCKNNQSVSISYSTAQNKSKDEGADSNFHQNILSTPKSGMGNRVSMLEQRTFDGDMYKTELHQITCKNSSLHSSIEKSARRLKSRELKQHKKQSRDIKCIKNMKLYGEFNQPKTVSRNPVLSKVEHSKNKSDGLAIQPKFNSLSTR